MLQTQDLESSTTLWVESEKKFGCKSPSTSRVDLSNLLKNEVELRDFSSTFKSSCIRDYETLKDIPKNADEKCIADNLLQSKHSDINLEEIMMKDVNISPWLRFGVERDPWQDCKLHCLPRLSFIDENSDPILKPEQVIANSKNLRQTPDKKFFALTKLELNNKGLEDISFLSTYRCFQYIDLSRNRLTNLEALNEMVYLIYLDASHNSLQNAICMEAPWYLTYINLSHNDITTIGDLSKFWSLQNINFSHNKIDCIQGFKNLKYLRCLDLSYNRIKCLENIGYLPLTYLNLEGNEISDWKETEKEDTKEINSESTEKSDWEETGKRGVKEDIPESKTLNEEFEENGGTSKVVINPNIKVINLKNNLLQSMELFKDLVLLEELNLGNNKIDEFVEIDYLKNKKMLKHLTLRGNHVSTINSYRILLLHYIPTLDSIDGDRITMEEREIIYKLQNIDSAENKYELLARKIFYEQLASVDYTIPGIVNDTCLPLIAIVGPFGSCRNELIEKLMNNHSEKLHYARNYICIPEELNDLVLFQQDKLIPRSQFNRMMASGQFLATSCFLGVEFGLSKIEYNKGVEAGKIVISLCDLTMAFCLQALGVNIRSILCITDSIELMNQRIQSQCEDLLLERDTFHPSIIPLSYKLLMQNWPSDHINKEKETKVQEFSSSELNETQSLTDPSIKIDSSSSSKSRYIEVGREQTVINFIQSRVIQTRNLYDDIKNCDSFIVTVYTDNFDGAYKSLKSTLENASNFISSRMCSLHVKNLYETVKNLQKKAIIEELHQSD
ncbi:hypothetical protein LSTR_LSTR009554 [Laodelphax striatellus]|uniref:Guanylate kinase-like domain-containing protein n=1 Tax=Laodelphax striatellus TaxID=195883 RepID=A0A482WSL2_LAOST|nr:hypothetical protein LSTR_LSTR009554 [Laodelphax striatellus]